MNRGIISINSGWSRWHQLVFYTDLEKFLTTKFPYSIVLYLLNLTYEYPSTFDSPSPTVSNIQSYRLSTPILSRDTTLACLKQYINFVMKFVVMRRKTYRNVELMNILYLLLVFERVYGWYLPLLAQTARLITMAIKVPSWQNEMTNHLSEFDRFNKISFK